MLEKESFTSKRSFVTCRSQNWYCSTMVISSGYCSLRRFDTDTPSAPVSKAM